MTSIGFRNESSDYASRQEDVAACEALYRDLSQASMEKDATWMRRLLAPDYVLVHMTGMKQTAADYIAAVLDGTLNYYSVSHYAIRVELADDGLTARIQGRSRVNAAVFGSGRHTWRLEQRLTAAKRNGVWLLTESRASTY
ncbi:MAG: nuclear transport factor 2 family protein [Eggerthellaceae bacterium]|nr:nuclear transport factor 2 family protein [Eggerthellaceae bacterium]